MIDASWVKEALSESDFRIREYSGRFMYGKQCLGIECDQYHTEYEAIACLIEAMPEDRHREKRALADMIAGARSDSLGLGTILYFPSIRWTDEWEESDEDTDSDDDDDSDEDNSDPGDLDGDAESALASAGFGTDEDYGG
mgnify:CR=1 FL=1